MSILTSLGILFLAMLILAFLQFIPSIFALSFHFLMGRYSTRKASDAATFFILGTETSIAILMFLFYFILSDPAIFTFILTNRLLAWIVVGILIALSLTFFFFYCHKKHSIELFIPRKVATSYYNKAKTIKTRSDAFVLGIVCIIPELLFTLPLYLLAAIEILKIGVDSVQSASLIILFSLLTILPLIIIHSLFSHQTNLADFIKFRHKNKTLFRVIISLLYLFIAILIILGIIL